MNTNTLVNDPRAKRWGAAAKWLLLFPVGFVIAPYVFTALWGLAGLVIGVLGMVATKMLAPWVYAKAANIRLKLIKAEASKNPVETLQDDLRTKTVALDERKTNIEKLNGQIRTFADKVDDIKSRYGPGDPGFVKLSADLTDLRRIYAHRCEKWKAARAQLERFGEEIERANMIWEAGQAAAAARETSGLTEEEFFAKLRTDTAFDAIQSSYNEALASLDTAMLDEPVKALPAPDARPVIELTSAQPSKVAR